MKQLIALALIFSAFTFSPAAFSGHDEITKKLKRSSVDILIAQGAQGDENALSELIQKYVDGSLDMSLRDLVTELDGQFLLKTILKKALTDDNYAFVVLELCRLGMIKPNKGNNQIREIIININKRAKTGISQAWYNLGLVYLFGITQTSSNSFAVDFLTRASDQGHPHAQRLLSSAHYSLASLRNAYQILRGEVHPCDQEKALGIFIADMEEAAAAMHILELGTSPSSY